MRSHLPLLGLLAASAVEARSEAHKRLLEFMHPEVRAAFPPNSFAQAEDRPLVEARKAKHETSHFFLNNVTKPFAVDGKGIPDVKYDVGESYAGSLPISDKKNETNELFFWLFPSDNEEHRKKKEITIWMNGGPGCSSLLGFLEENGPFVWRPGTLEAVENPWSWHHLTNIVWVEQPVTVGFSKGNSTVHNEDDVAEQFMGFWKNFVETFSMQGYTVYIVGESYGGYYAPYIASHFINSNNNKYYKVGGMMVVDGVSFQGDLQSEVIAEAFVEQNYNLMPFADPFMDKIRNVSESCGYRDYLKKYWTYPPSGLQPSVMPWINVLPNGTEAYKPGCGELWSDIFLQALKDNPCFNPYNIIEFCPGGHDPLAENPYFNRQDVKKAIHAPLDVTWGECVNSPFGKGGDQSEPPSKYELPNVIDKTKNVIYVQGGNDYLLAPSGVLLAIQNMTFGGLLGFQTRPQDPFYVPRWGYDPDRNGDYYGLGLPDKSGVVGTTHTERGLTVAVTNLAGHEGPEYASTAALRQLEKLLGRVESLSDTVPFTLPGLGNVKQDSKPLGRGTYPVPSWIGRH